MEMSAPKDGLLPCPLCGARRFYTGIGGKEISFSLNVSGSPRDTVPEDMAPFLTEDTVIHCVFCSWSGTVGELTGEGEG